MSRWLLLPFGVALLLIGGVTIAYPQRVHDQGSARRRYEDGRLSEEGRLQQRGLGVASIVLGLAPIGIAVV